VNFNGEKLKWKRKILFIALKLAELNNSKKKKKILKKILQLLKMGNVCGDSRQKSK
jgi:hypothetical protein